MSLIESLEFRCLLSAGDLDSSFGVVGRVTTLIGTGNSAGLSAVGTIQSNGKIVVAGSVYDNGNQDFALVRYNGDGSLDSSFDGDGTVTTDFGTADEHVSGVAIHTDGKITVAGWVMLPGPTAYYEFAVARYNSDGSLDTSFDGDGKLTTDFGSSAVATSMVLQPDGKIIVAGYSSGLFALARYNVDGSLDTSFDGDGLLTTVIGVGPGNDQANGLALQADGKIVVAGQTSRTPRGIPNFAIVRYNSDGSVDSSFDSDGIVSTNFGELAANAKSVAVQADGKLVVVGIGSSPFGVLLARYNSDGSLDLSFDGDGKQRTYFSTFSDSGFPVVLQPDGKIVVATTQGSDFAVLRFNSDGAFDRTFGSNGAVLTDFGFSFDQAQSIALQSDGKIVVAGLSQYDVYSFAIARYLSGRPTVITSSPAVSISENQTSVAVVTATSEQSEPLLFGITGGADQSKFTLNFLTGALSFVSPPDFEQPADAEHDNAYEVQVAVSDGTHLITQNVTVSVTNVNEDPVITSNGGGTTASINIPENQTNVTTMTATDVDMPAQKVAFSITGGADATKFNISSGGVLTFLTTPDFENPTDADVDNVYVVQVTATDDGPGNLTDSQIFVVTVTDVTVVTGAPLITGPPLANSSQRPPISWTAVNGATEYEIWIAKNPGTSLYHGATATSNSYTPPMDFGIGKFSLWIRAKNSESLGPWTAKYTFVINTPVASQTITRQQPTLRPTISWNSLPGAVKYDVWIDDASRSITQYIRNINVTGTTFTPSADLPLGVYRAWVRGIAADGTAGSWSPAVEFVTMQGPTITQGQNPTFHRTPTFAWSPLAGAARYEVIIRNRNTGATAVDERNITGLSFTPTAPLADGPYRWWVVGVSAQGVRSFGAAPLDIYIGGRTDLLTPSGISNVPAPRFIWRPVDGAVRYDLWVNQIGGQSQIIRQQNLITTSYTPGNSLPAGSYRAWIRAISSSGEFSPWSLEVAFAVAAIPQPSQSESLHGIPDDMIAVLAQELQSQRLGSNNTRVSSRSAEVELLPPTERTLKIVADDRISPQLHESCFAQFADEHLVAAIH